MISGELRESARHGEAPGPGHHRKLSPSLFRGISGKPSENPDYREAQPEPELQQPGGEGARK